MSMFVFQGMIQNDIAMSRVEIDQARLLTLQAARCIDCMGTKRARKQVNMLAFFNSFREVAHFSRLKLNDLALDSINTRLLNY